MEQLIINHGRQLECIKRACHHRLVTLSGGRVQVLLTVDYLDLYVCR